MMRMVCFYHSADLDGHCSGAILRHRYGSDVELVGIDYDDDFPWDLVDAETEVCMVDFSLEPIEEMVRLKELCGRLHWIDHHKTAIDEADRVGFTCPGLRMVGKAGCELTWVYTFPMMDVPHPVWLLGRYDVWDLGASPNVLSFQYGMRMEEETRPEADVDVFTGLWAELFVGYSPRWEEINDRGEIALVYEKSTNVKLMRACAFGAELDGLRVVAANVPMASSQKFESVWDPIRHDAMCAFYRKGGGKWVVSLYSDKDGVDVSGVCLARGGGGHKGAAGFACNELPEELR